MHRRLKKNKFGLMKNIRLEMEQALRDIVQDRMSCHQGLLDQHGKDESFHALRSPDVVVYPASNEEVSQIVRLCARTGTAMVPFGAGTSLEGHIAAIKGGVCLDMSQMNQILEINASDLDCRVQAGVTRKQLNAGLKHHGQFFAVDPGADATLGGMVSTRASGANAVRYGTMKDNVLGLTVVMPDGVIVRTGSRARKSAAGYDLTRLLCGTEGTLGVITEVQLRCFGLPEAHAVGVCSFAGVSGWPTAVCVPISRLAMCIVETQADLKEFDLLAPIVGHVGEGNFHLLLLVDEDSADELAIAQQVNDRLIKRALRMGGTSTGEHGIGYGKLP
jgi:FAD/FMN-containing dehydrogenase